MRIFCPAIGPCPLRSRTPGLVSAPGPWWASAACLSSTLRPPRSGVSRPRRKTSGLHDTTPGGSVQLWVAPDGCRIWSSLRSPCDPVRCTQTTGSIKGTRFRSQGVPHPGDPPEQPEHLDRLRTPTPNRNDGGAGGPLPTSRKEHPSLRSVVRGRTIGAARSAPLPRPPGPTYRLRMAGPVALVLCTLMLGAAVALGLCRREMGRTFRRLRG